MTDPSGTMFTPEEIKASQDFLASPAFKTLSEMQQRRGEEHRQQMADTTAQISALTSKLLRPFRALLFVGYLTKTFLNNANALRK